jgi:hypothetical protein
MICSLLLFILPLPAQPPNWPAEVDSIRPSIKTMEEASARLIAEIEAWKKQGRQKLTGAQQVRWSSLMAELNQNYQTLVSFSDRGEAARRLSPKELVKRFALPNAIGNKDLSARYHLQLLTLLLAADRALYATFDSLRATVGNSLAIRNRLNEGNRSFGLQYGIFEEMTAAFFDPTRHRRTRSRFLQLRGRKNFLDAIIKKEDFELYHAANHLLDDPTLQRIASRNDASVLFASSIAAAGSIIDPAGDLVARTMHNFSQFFGNLVGTNLFRVADFLGIGESRGHAEPAFHKYYPHPEGRAKGVHPAKVAEMEGSLRPGDILFEKNRFAITDKLIPGYFGHVAIYLGSYEALQALGVFDTAVMRQATNGMAAAAIDAHVEAFAREIETIPLKEAWLRLAIMRRRTQEKNFNGRPLSPLLFEALYRLRYRHENVLEALRDGQTISALEGGVTLNPFAHFLYIDDFAAIRLRHGGMSEEQHRQNLARFLALGLLQYGKPYDFRFDVNTIDAIVCSELIYQSFVDIEFSTGKSLASSTISPDQVAQEAGIKTTLDTLRLAPQFELVQWHWEAMPLYPPSRANAPAAATTGIIDTLAFRAFMAMVREEYGGLRLLSPVERKQFESFKEKAKQEREKESERLRNLPATYTTIEPEAAGASKERALQNFYIDLQKKILQAQEAGEAQEEIAAIKQQALEKFLASQAGSNAPDSSERVKALSDHFEAWRIGPAYIPSYDDLYSGKERFLLSVFRSASLADDNRLGHGVDLQFAGNNEAPRRSLIYTQYYAFLPFHVQLFDGSGTIRKTVQGGVSLARIARRYTQGDYVEMNALEWRNTAYTTLFSPFSLEAGGDKGPLDAALKLTTIGNGHHQRGVYIGELGRIELVPFETRSHRRAYTIANLFYGARAQLTLGKFRLYAKSAVGTRLGNFAEREKQNPATTFPQLRTWAFGLELSGSTLYRPTSHRLQFEVVEDDARFIQGRVQKDRRARLLYQWSVND